MDHRKTIRENIKEQPIRWGWFWVAVLAAYFGIAYLVLYH